MGLFSRVFDTIKAVAAEDDPALEQHLPDVPPGVTPIARTEDRQRVIVQGRVRVLTLPTASSVTALIVEIADGTGSLRLVFVGRKAIPGIACGVVLRAQGRVSVRDGLRVIYNPIYEIVPRPEPPRDRKNLS